MFLKISLLTVTRFHNLNSSYVEARTDALLCLCLVLVHEPSIKEVHLDVPSNFILLEQTPQKMFSLARNKLCRSFPGQPFIFYGLLLLPYTSSAKELEEKSFCILAQNLVQGCGLPEGSWHKPIKVCFNHTLIFATVTDARLKEVEI
jgi:hypothetical protein